MATCSTDSAVVAPILSLIVHRTLTLLPPARRHLSIVEDDSIPDGFLSAPAVVDEAGGLAAALMGQRTAPTLTWKLPALPLGKAAPEWEEWGRELLKESWRNAPISAQPFIVVWQASAFSLAAGQADMDGPRHAAGIRCVAERGTGEANA